uniref:Uncharacterized protein n=1 Tax=Strongyloides papillosus TaxID=174720 RepID=A0A0N5B220_STREA
MRNDENVAQSPPVTVVVKRGRDNSTFAEVGENSNLENNEHETTENDKKDTDLKERKGIWRKQDEIFVPE